MFSCLAKSHFKHKIFKDIIPAYSWKPRFFNLMCKPHRNSVFWCLPKGISNRRFEDIQIHYSSPPLQSQILQFYVQNSVCWGIPKGILNRWFLNILFLPTPESVDFIFLQNSIFDAFPKAFQIDNRRYSNSVIPACPWTPRFSNSWCQTWCFEAFPKAFQIEDVQRYQ